MGEINEILQALTQELRRGTIVLSVLSQLDSPAYGYTLVKNMEEKEKAQLASNLKNAAEEMLSLNEMENVEGGGIVDINPKCVQNKVAGCGCTIAKPDDSVIP